MSPTIPARCTHCGYKWDGAGGIRAADSTFEIRDVGLSCPRCGAIGDIAEGRFNVRSGGIEVLEGPAWTWDLVDELKLTLRRIVDERPADPVAAIADVSPELAQQVAQSASGLSLDRTIALIALVHAALFADYSNVSALSAAVRFILEHAHGL